MTPRQLIKRCIFRPLALWHRGLAVLASTRDVRMPREEALALLKQHGYEIRPLWSDIKPMSPAELDLSIIIPVYNAEEVLPRCLDSLVAQQAEGISWEIVCVDDGSTDCSGVILARYAREYPRRLRVVSQPNGGIAAARNRGLLEARGQYVGFIDNDDAVALGYVAALMREARRSGADMVQCGYRYVDAAGRVMSIEAQPAGEAGTGDPEKMCRITSGYIWGGVLHRRLFAQVRFPEGFWYEDMITKMVLMRIAGKVARIAEPLYTKYIHANNASVTLWRTADIKSADCWLLASLLCRHLRENLGIAPDATQLRLLLYEWGPMLASRTQGLSVELSLALFSLCADDIAHFKKHQGLSGSEKRLLDIFREGSYSRWKHLSMAEAYTHR